MKTEKEIREYLEYNQTRRGEKPIRSTMTVNIMLDEVIGTLKWVLNED